jgi:two-component system, sensor histidine kinase and response regulator
VELGRRSPVLVGLWAVEAVLVLVHLVSPIGALGDTTYLVGVWLAPVLAWIGTAAAPADRRLVPGLIAAGLTSSAVGDLIWMAYTWAGQEPDVSVADVFFFASYLGLAAAVGVMTTVRRGRRTTVDPEALIDALTVIVLCLLVFWVFSISDITADETVSATTRAVWAAYPVLDAVLLALVLRATTMPRAREALGVWFGLGVMCWLFADIAYLALELTDAAVAAMDIGWMLGGMLMATSTLRPQEILEEETDEAPLDQRSQVRRLLIAIGPLLVPPSLLFASAAVRGDSKPLAILIGMFALVAIAFVRTARLLASEARARVELAAARDAALEGSRAKSAFLATMSHEIRTPMNGVIGLTDLLLTTPLDDRQRQYAEGVRGAGHALLAIINDILDFSKVEAGRLDLEELDFDVVHLVEEVADLVAEPAREKDLELLAYCSPEVPVALRGDPARLRQVLLNLVGNAVKFTPSGEVVLRAQLESRSATGAVVRFEVSDTGIGIAPELRDDLFDPFSQADSSTTRQYGGTGLGLAICRQLVHAMGGEIGLTSVAGEGSTFWATVPLGIAHDVHVAPPRSAEGLAGLRCLVVDDNATNRMILHDQLGAWGMRVDTAESGTVALEAMVAAVRAGRPYDLAVLDLCMPGMDGLELARRITADPAVPARPLVLLTSGPDVAQDEAREAGIATALTKPVALTRLRTTLAGLVTAPPAAPVAPVETRSSGKGRVLVVEDGEINQLVATGILESLGYSVSLADDGLAALDALARATYDAVLMDVQMPNMDGYQATAEIRGREAGLRHTPIIAMTASAIEGDRERCLAAGMDDYISKPVNRAAVDEVLSRWVPAT